MSTHADEIWFCAILRREGVRNVFDGLTTYEQRRESVRAQMRELGIAESKYQNSTLGAIFEKTYGEPL